MKMTFSLILSLRFQGSPRSERLNHRGDAIYVWGKTESRTVVATIPGYLMRRAKAFGKGRV